ncbi:MAG TPA: hypothetical protein VFS23_10115, partial [Vicinamibacterales bacterium]|nr:hypothetical protein [Vicinamibacterales bacterium]
MSRTVSLPGIGQQPAMTPQLQQAFRLLQMPAPALQAHIQHALENNVMLEAHDDFDATWAMDTLADPDGPWSEMARSKVR